MSLDFLERFMDGLRKKQIRTPSEWIQSNCRTQDGAQMSMRRFPWTVDMLNSKAEENCAMKGAQLGVTNMALMRGICANLFEHRDVLYVLPNLHPDASAFSAARFDATVLASPALNNVYDRSNVGHKQAGTNSFYIRGGQSRSGLKSVPVWMLVLDELNEMEEKNIPLAEERTSGQLSRLIWYISTPTAPDHGISKEFAESSQEHYFFPCPACTITAPNSPTRARMIELYPEGFELDEPRCLQIIGDDPDSALVQKESYLKCPECGTKIPHDDKQNIFEKALWIPSIHGKEKRGFYINQFYSTTVTPGAIAASWLRAKISPMDLQEFWNSKMGLPHALSGSQITEEQVNACKGTYANGSPKHENRITTLGSDIGTFNHYEVCEWLLPVNNNYADINEAAVPRVLKTGKVRDWEQLDTLMLEYDVQAAVVDAHPERRNAYSFAKRFPGRVYMALYGQGVSGKLLHEHKSDIGEPLVTVDRTSWLDQALQRFQNRTITLPHDPGFEYVEHITKIMRSWVKDAHGNPHAVYVTNGRKTDHHAHSRCYAEIALALSTNNARSYDMENPL